MQVTQHTPADVRERVARECVEEAERLGRWYGDGYAKARRLLREAAALLLTPRGDEEAWRAFLDALDEFESAANLWVDPEGPTAEDMERLDRARQRVIECGRALAGLRSEARGEEDVGEVCDLCGEMFDPSELGTVIGPLGQDDGVPRWYRCPRCARAYDAGYQQGQRDPRGDEIADPTAIRSDADALDLIRWAEARAVALEPVAGNIMPPGTYACYAGDAGEPYMGPGILGAIRAARRGEEQGQERWEDLVFGPITEAYNEAHAARLGEAPGDGPVGAVCANCGAPNAAIAGGELDPDEAVCSSECYDQLKELGCPQEHGGTYRPKPARRSEGGGA